MKTARIWVLGVMLSTFSWLPVHADQLLIEMSNQLLAIENKMADLRGELEESQYEIAELKAAQTQQYADFQQQIEAMKQAHADEIAQLKAEQLEQGSEVVVQATDTVIVTSAEEAEQAYERAKQYVFDRDYEAAVSAFEAVTELYPNSEQSGNAFYWLGEMYLVIEQPDIDKAAESFIKSIENEPGSARKPDALIRAAQTLEALGQPNAAKEFAKQLVNDYPEHNQVPDAQLLIERLSTS